VDPLDKELEKLGVSFVRYADDIAIFASSPKPAERILESTVKWFKKELGLEVKTLNDYGFIILWDFAEAGK